MHRQARCFVILSSHLPGTTGDNSDGSLGYGDTYARGNTGDHGLHVIHSEMGCNLPLVNLGNYPVVAVIAGQGHNCGLLQVCDTFQLKCWGAPPAPFSPVTSDEIETCMLDREVCRFVESAVGLAG
jgi:hypothetical protein